MITDEAELRAAFAGRPDARYRPVAGWWWSGEALDEERLLWQLDRIHAMGCGGIALASLAPFGPAGSSVGDDPALGTPERTRLQRVVFERCRELGMGVIILSPHQLGGVRDLDRLLTAHPDQRAELVQEGPRVVPFGFDMGNPRAVAEFHDPGTVAGAFERDFADLFGDPIVGVFEDEIWPFALWAPDFAEQHRRLRGEDAPVTAFLGDDDAAAPARRWAMFDVARQRVERAYTEPFAAWVDRHRMLAGYDQMSRSGVPIMASAYYLDPFRTMAWANAPGTDQMGDARFHLSIADLTSSRRVWLEGFHSHGQGLSLAHMASLTFEWAREGASLLYLHGLYYASRGLWWEWAPPETGWRQPYERHWPAFADAIGRLMAVASAGRHVPEVAVLYPLSTVWADTRGYLDWGDAAMAAHERYVELMGVHGVPVWDQAERWQRPSLLADAGYDRVVVNEDWLDRLPSIPLILPACICLAVETLRRIVEDAEAGRTVIVVEPVPQWSAERGRDDPEVAALVERLGAAAAIVPSAAAAVAALPPARTSGVPVQWRRVGELDLLLATGTGELRLHGTGARRAERLEIRDGSVHELPARQEGGDLVIAVEGPITVVALRDGSPAAAAAEAIQAAAEAIQEEVPLPERWECRYVEWGENRWGDLRLPANPGTPPTERRTFAWREGDDPAWRSAPVVPEDQQQPLFTLGFEDRMSGNLGRVAPAERLLAGGWREAVSTFGPHGSVDGVPAEYSERFGIEDLVMDTPFGIKGYVEPWKVDLGDRGGRVTSHAHVASACATHLVVEAVGRVDVTLDGQHLLGPVEAGVLAIPVELQPGWHEVSIEAQPPRVPHIGFRGYRRPPRCRVSWSLMEPYARRARGVWGGRVMHPDYRGAPQARRFRREIVLPEAAEVTVRHRASGPVTMEVPDRLPAGTHVIEAFVGEALVSPYFACRLDLRMGGATLSLVTDEQWETSAPGEDWQGVLEIDAGGALGGRETLDIGEDDPHSPLLDVSWLQGEEARRGHRETLWADSPEPPPPSWFAFLAPPGARAMSLPVDGEVQAWVDGEPADLTGGRLALREHARVALRVQAPAGRRGPACFREHPILELGDGTISTGMSWHRQGLDCFTGLIQHTTTVLRDTAGEAMLDLGEVRGSVGVRVNGAAAGVLFCAPWRLPITLVAGENRIELEVANTLGPMVGRGVPTAFGPEDQRISGILGRPRLLIRR